MQRFTAVIAALLAAASANAERVSFDSWTTQFNKEYTSPEERALREAIFNVNADRIEAHNAKGLSYTLRLDAFSDMTNEERVGRRPGAMQSRKLRGETFVTEESPRDLQGPPPPPPSIDLTVTGKIRTPVDSADCNGAYAVNIVGIVEWAWNIKYNTQVWGSIQEMIDCTASYGNDGCWGGSVGASLSYIANHGLAYEGDYPYIMDEQSCGVSSLTHDIQLGQVGQIQAHQDYQIQLTLASGRPVMVALDTMPSTFQSYSGGVYSDWYCGSYGATNAYGLIVGYGVDTTYSPALNYFKVRMDLGTSWGESGYIRIKRDTAVNAGNGICSMYQNAGYYSWIN